MNAIQVLNRVNFYNDVTRSARFYFSEISVAVNQSIKQFIDKNLGDVEHRNVENFQWVQQVRDSLYNLITVSNPTISNGTVVVNKYFSHTPSSITFPVGYEDLISLRCTIDGETTYARPTTANALGPLLEDSFKHPTNQKPYYLENNTGLTIWRGVGGTFSQCSLEYLRAHNDFTLGNESNLINAGVGVLTNGASYIAVETSVQNGVTRAIGTQFTAVGTTLTSGQVILASLTNTIDLPEKTHDEICLMASRILLGVTADIQQSQVVDALNKG
jgi:hypothetical protein